MRNTTIIVLLLVGPFVFCQQPSIAVQVRGPPAVFQAFTNPTFLPTPRFRAGARPVLPDEIIAFQYKGENVNCNGIRASISSDPNTVVESEEGVVIAVSQAMVQALHTINRNPTVDTVVAEAAAAEKLVLEVVARAVATVSAEINSPNPGCWAIAYGKAEAVAIANATVTAISQAFAQAANWQSFLFAQAAAQVESAEREIEVAVKEVAVLLADGSGSGRQSAQASVEANANATAVNCALAQAFAAVAEGVADIDVLARVGCLSTPPPPSPPPPPPPQACSYTNGVPKCIPNACDCIEKKTNGAPFHCGFWGQQNTNDHICYVKAASCPCAVSSSLYSGMSWRYCGPTMKEMQMWLTLTFQDIENKIVSKGSKYGYCAYLNDQDDKLTVRPARTTTINIFQRQQQSTPTPPPPAPAPTPIISNCPSYECIGDRSSCCSQSGPTCTTQLGRIFDYLGKCASTGQDVWAGTFECFCP